MASLTMPAMRSAAARLMTGPTSVDGSVGSPRRSSLVRLASRSTSSPATSGWTISREVDVQRCPLVPKAPKMAPSTTRSRSASGRTTMAFFPPSSRDTRRGPVSMAAAATFRPVGTDPVKLTAPTPGWTAMAAPGSAKPWTSWMSPSGTPASRQAATNASAQAGACSEGLRTIPLPARSAGKHFHDGMATGKFHGVIIPMTPTGARVVQHSFEPSSEGTVPAQAGHEVGHVDGFLHVAARLDEDLAALPGDELGQWGLSGGEDLAGLDDDARPGRDRHPGPAPLRLGRGAHRPVDVLGALHRV